MFSLERLVRNQMMLLGCQWRFDRWHRILLEEGSVLSVRRCCQLHAGRGPGLQSVVVLEVAAEMVVGANPGEKRDIT